jgi:hypothetical protein
VLSELRDRVRAVEFERAAERGRTGRRVLGRRAVLDPAPVVRWCVEHALRTGAPLPRGLADTLATAPAIEPAWLGAAALGRLESLGLERPVARAHRHPDHRRASDRARHPLSARRRRLRDDRTEPAALGRGAGARRHCWRWRHAEARARRR